MRIKYLGNSGFAVGLEKSILIFDDISQGAFIEKESLLAFENIIVFVSHAHSDHFSPDIFSNYENGKSKVSYVLSEDVTQIYPTQLAEDINLQIVKEGDRLHLGDFNIHVYGSTDEGVSFDTFSPYNGKIVRIFHAGDLNNWHWENENNEEWSYLQQTEFTRIIQQIDPNPRIDVAFFPFDTKLGADYYRGATQFVERFNPAMTVPMHFGLKWKEDKEMQERFGEKTLFCPLLQAGMAFDALLK